MVLYVSLCLSCGKSPEYEPDPEFRYIPFAIELSGYCGSMSTVPLEKCITDLATKKANEAAIRVEVNWTRNDGSGAQKVNQIKIIDNKFYVAVPIGKKFKIYTSYWSECKTCNKNYGYDVYYQTKASEYDDQTKDVKVKIFHTSSVDCSITPNFKKE